MSCFHTGAALRGRSDRPALGKALSADSPWHYGLCSLGVAGQRSALSLQVLRQQRTGSLSQKGQSAERGGTSGLQERGSKQLKAKV